MSGSFTESTLLDLVSDDGMSGFMLRLARHVDEGVAWAWLVTYGPEGIHGFVEDRLPCSGTRTSDDSSVARYRVDLPASHGASAWIERLGSAEAPSGGTCEIDVMGHRTSEIPRGPGTTRIRVRARFKNVADEAGSNLPGRNESIVMVDADISVGEVSRTLRGFGQFHEQLQDAPRFDIPFTYMSLRSEDVSLVGMRGPKAGRAVMHEHGEVRAHLGFTVDPLVSSTSMDVRHMQIEGSDGSHPIMTGLFTPTLRYTVPIAEGRRPSAIVTGEINGCRVVGFVNDWTPTP